MTPDDSTAIAVPPPTARARVTNGSRLHAGGVDGRSSQARRWKDAYRSILGELGDNPSESQRQLARRCATLITTGEQLDAQAAAGAAVDPLALVRTTGALQRVLGQLGLHRLNQRQPKVLPPEPPIDIPSQTELEKLSVCELSDLYQRVVRSSS